MGLLLELSLAGGCAKVCDDDGFAWQQDPSCLGSASNTETETAPDSDSEPTETATVPTTTNGGEGTSYCVDGDGDGHGDASNCTDVPDGDEPPPGTVPNDDDCDDMDGHTFPGSAPKDSETECMKDADDDDYGDDDPPGDGGPGEPVPGTDCDDDNPNTFPGSAENEDDPTACMNDDDGDGFGDPEDPDGPDGPGQGGTDCDDNDPDQNEMCAPTCTDEDGDGCSPVECSDGMFPPTCPVPAADCDDGDPDTFPGSAPKDDPEACMTDVDDDDYGDDTPSDPDAIPGTDCDDGDSTAFPGSAPLDSMTACMKDGDDDDHGDADPDNPNVMPGNDCNDQNPSMNPTDSQLITAAVGNGMTGDVLEVDVGTGMLTSVGSVDTMGFSPWVPTGVAINPADRSVYASLSNKTRLVTMNYCGGGVPTALAPHGRNFLCSIGFDKDGVLWGVDLAADELIQFNADGSIFSHTELTFEGQLLNIVDCGMTWDCHMGRMILSDTGTNAIYEVNTADATTTKLAQLDEMNDPIGAGLVYEPVSKQALTCFGTGFYSVALDGTNEFTKLADLMSAEDVDDLEYAPACE